MRYVIDHSPVEIDKLSPDGRKLIHESRDIINTARLIVQEKNADELFQNFIWHTRGIDADRLKPGGLTEKPPADSQKAQTDGEEGTHRLTFYSVVHILTTPLSAVKHLRTLLTLVLTNSEVRKLFYDFSVIGRDLLAKGATKTAELIAPNEEKLRQVDQSAPNDQFITEGGRVAGPGETPILESGILGTDKKIKAHPHEQVRVKHEDGTERPLDEHIDTAKEKYSEFNERATSSANTAQEKGRAIASADKPAEVAEEKKHGVIDKMRQFRVRILDLNFVAIFIDFFS